jgi:hypothetical protein
MKLEGKVMLLEIEIPLNNAVNKMLEFGCNRLFIDLSKNINNVDNMEIFKLPKMLKDVGLNPNHKQAVVVAHNFQERKKLENFCIYHDFSIKFFTNAQKAKQWLSVQ